PATQLPAESVRWFHRLGSVCLDDIDRLFSHPALPAPDIPGIAQVIATENLLDASSGVALLLQAIRQLVELVDAPQIHYERHGVRPLARRTDTGFDASLVLLGQHLHITLQVIDGGDRSIRTNPNSILAADIHRMVDVRNDIVSRCVAGLVEEG